MTQLVADAFSPSPAYLRQLKNLRERATPAVRYATAWSLLDQARKEHSAPARKFRMIWDLAHLIRAEPAPPTQSTDGAVLLNVQVVFELSDFVDDLARRPPPGAPADLIRDLQTLVQETAKTTWLSFQAFLDSEVGRQQFKLTESLDDLASYDEWLAIAMPAIGLDLPDDRVGMETELKRRIEVLLTKVAPSDDPADDPFGLRERAGRDIALYVHLHLEQTEADAV